MTGTQGTDLILINEAFVATHVRPQQLDVLLESGWRHFGEQFFRYSLNVYKDEIRRVIPLRVRLANFRLSKSQRRNLKKNADLEVISRPIRVDNDVEELFHRHKARFESSVPSSIYEFISFEPTSVPCVAREMAVYDQGRLVAISYFDVGASTVSGIYAMFEPECQSRGLGTFTMLKEIEFAREARFEFYYQGYAYEGNSFYEYKKRLSGTEAFDWKGRWEPL